MSAPQADTRAGAARGGVRLLGTAPLQDATIGSRSRAASLLS
ncbi:hypothetical protein AB0C13_09000 [Streptomyces sp. NPDC049099]